MAWLLIWCYSFLGQTKILHIFSDTTHHVFFGCPFYLVLPISISFTLQVVVLYSWSIRLFHCFVALYYKCDLMCITTFSHFVFHSFFVLYLYFFAFLLYLHCIGYIQDDFVWMWRRPINEKEGITYLFQIIVIDVSICSCIQSKKE